ncbi:hypothetical protein GCM10027610_055550 [Dactylosporangium cerinum]
MPEINGLSVHCGRFAIASAGGASRVNRSADGCVASFADLPPGESLAAPLIFAERLARLAADRALLP